MGSIRPAPSGTPPYKLQKARLVTEIAANVVIICAVGLVALVLLDRTVASSSRTAFRDLTVAPSPGTPIRLTGVDWSAHASTLIVAISSTCPHCMKETSFYSDITRSAHRTPIIVVMPQETQTAQSFLGGYHITPSRAISADLQGIQVKVTPTLILISSSGVVRQTWVGELNDTQKREVFQALDHL